MTAYYDYGLPSVIMVEDGDTFAQAFQRKAPGIFGTQFHGSIPSSYVKADLIYSVLSGSALRLRSFPPSQSRRPDLPRVQLRSVAHYVCAFAL